MNEIYDKLKASGIHFSKGLTKSEIDRIEEIYNIRFPKSLIDFYSLGLPLSKDDQNVFPNWADFSDANITKIKERIQSPIKNLIYDIKNRFWLSAWGKRAESEDDAIKQFEEVSSIAPKLIPIYSHRYTVWLEGIDDPPVISAVGCDIIYYGCNLTQYLQNEFLFDNKINVSDKCIYIPFWSDIITAK